MRILRSNFSGGSMARRRFGALAIALAMSGSATAGAQPAQPQPQPQAPPPPPEVGVWYDDTGDGAIELRPCGTKLCGFIFWLKDPISTRTGKPKVDFYNPDESKRSRPICGLQVLGGLERQSDGTWDNGWVYDPKVGKAYDAAIELDGRSKLRMTGYKGIKLFSKTLVWTRAPGELARCTNG